MNIVHAILASWAGRIGLLCLALGAAFMGYASYNAPPARASLKTIEGTVTEAQQITRTRTRKGEGKSITGIDYVITVTPDGGGAPVKLTMPSDLIKREQVQAIIREKVKAEYDSESDVYFLSAGARVLIAFATTQARRNAVAQTWTERGRIALGLGIPLVIAGWPLGARKRRKEAVAAAAQPPAA